LLLVVGVEDTGVARSLIDELRDIFRAAGVYPFGEQRRDDRVIEGL
jgi:hypothetical protein